MAIQSFARPDRERVAASMPTRDGAADVDRKATCYPHDVTRGLVVVVVKGADTGTRLVVVGSSSRRIGRSLACAPSVREARRSLSRGLHR